MLTESILAGVQAFPAGAAPRPPQGSHSLPVIRDAGIFQLAWRPHFEQTTVFKKSTAPIQGVACSENHVFAAQADRAVVHVYGRDKGNQELTVPFPEKVKRVLTAGEGGSWVVLGMESGSVLVWETYNGRLLKMNQSHIQSVTAMAVDSESKFLITGSADSTVLVWAFASILAYEQDGLADNIAVTTPRTPQHTLTNHRGPITGLAMGHSHFTSSFVMSLSEDSTAILWNYASGTVLRTYLLQSIPRAVAIDPADRAAYVGYDNGNVQMLDFYIDPQSGADLKTNIADMSAIIAPFQPDEFSLWTPPPPLGEKDPGIGAVNCLSLSFDATRLLSGHANGKIAAWDVGRGQYSTDVCMLPGSVTNLTFLFPTGFPGGPKHKSAINIPAVVKPRIETGGIYDLENFTVQAELRGHVDANPAGAPPTGQAAFDALLSSTFFPPEMLWRGVAQLQQQREETAGTVGTGARTGGGGEDFVALADKGGEELAPDEQVKLLRDQVRSLQNTQQESFKIIRTLRKEKEALLAER